MQKRFDDIWWFIQKNRPTAAQFRNFDYFAFLLMLSISLFGVVCIFSATMLPVEHEARSLLELLSSQSLTYPRYQLFWIGAGLTAMFFILLLDYKVFERFTNLIYWGNVVLLTIVLFMEKGRGGMAGWFRWGGDMMRTMQPSEFGKLAIIISLAKLFTNRKQPIQTMSDLLPVVAYVGMPLLLILAQPDFGTAMVYIVIFAVMLFVSGTNQKLIWSILIVIALLLIPGWYYFSTSDSFRVDRIRVFLNPELDPNGAGMQMYNARMAVGSAGLWGKGLHSNGSFATLNYIPDDYTDFIFAIVCESFGLVGAGLLVLALLVMLIRLLVLALRSTDDFGRYFIIGYTAMLMFHMIENIGMVIGLLPVTGIPLSFVSYGGSNMITNIMGYAIVLNIAMRNKGASREIKPKKPVQL